MNWTWFEEFPAWLRGKMGMADPLTNLLPDLVILVRRDGVILAHSGGNAPLSTGWTRIRTAPRTNYQDARPFLSQTIGGPAKTLLE